MSIARIFPSIVLNPLFRKVFLIYLCINPASEFIDKHRDILPAALCPTIALTKNMGGLQTPNVIVHAKQLTLHCQLYL